MAEMLPLVFMLWLVAPTVAGDGEEAQPGVDWLTKFGYLPPPHAVNGQLQTEGALSRAIRAMQKFGGLKETGVLDEATLALMETPRCSLPDVLQAQQGAGPRWRRRRGLTPHNKWNKKHLSWRLRTFPKESALLGVNTVRALMFYALKVWSDMAPLNFHEVAGSKADIQIDFTKDNHNDGYPFDGPGGAVAHALFPGERFTAGETHFDDDEAWTFRSPDSHGIDLFAVAVHEFGHVIGLDHTSALESIMRPYYQGPVGDPLKYQLPYQDKVRIWQLYGVRDSLSHTDRPRVPVEATPTPDDRSSLVLAPDTPDRCSSPFDAVAQIRGEAFFFRGRFFWRLTRERHLVSLGPAQIHRFWTGLPSTLDGVDAVYERSSDHKIVFFRGQKYWLFKDNIMEEGYPRPISDFGLPPDGPVDAAFVWLHNDKTYFFKDGHYWRYDERLRRMDPGYPKDSLLWKGLPPHLDDAMSWSDGSSYFFKGRDYWQVTGNDMEAEPGYPRPIGQDWLLCANMQSDPVDGKDDGGACSCTSAAHCSPATAATVGSRLALLCTLLLAIQSLNLL